jgi:glycosyltransferase involved in cell wall biosynthesis
VSRPYLGWISNFSGCKRVAPDIVVPLTVPQSSHTYSEILDTRLWWSRNGIKFDEVPIISFVGSFMSVFDFCVVRDAAIQLEQRGVRCKFVLAGSGGSFEETKRLMAGLKNVIFPGWIDGLKAKVLYANSICALVPYKNIDNYKLNTPNKVIDAMANGLPIVTSLTGEVQRLVELYACGFCCNGNNGLTFVEALHRLIKDTHLHKKMSANSLQLYRDQFLFEKVYGGLVNYLENLGNFRPHPSA